MCARTTCHVGMAHTSAGHSSRHCTCLLTYRHVQCGAERVVTHFTVYGGDRVAIIQISNQGACTVPPDLMGVRCACTPCVLPGGDHHRRPAQPAALANVTGGGLVTWMYSRCRALALGLPVRNIHALAIRQGSRHAHRRRVVRTSIAMRAPVHVRKHARNQAQLLCSRMPPVRHWRSMLVVSATPCVSQPAICHVCSTSAPTPRVPP